MCVCVVCVFFYWIFLSRGQPSHFSPNRRIIYILLQVNGLPIFDQVGGLGFISGKKGIYLEQKQQGKE